MFKADEYFRRFKDLPPVVLDEPITEEHVVEIPAVEEKTASIDVSTLSTLDRTILQLKEEKHPHGNITHIGLFAVLVQDAMGGRPCLADIENRVRQWQMGKWKGIV